MPTFGGVDIFGECVKVRPTVNPVATQENEFFGQTGKQSLFGGGRGRTFSIRGLLVGATPEVVVSAQQTLYSYADGIARAFVDNDGVTWTNVVFDGNVEFDEGGIRPCVPFGYARGYSMILRGLQ